MPGERKAEGLTEGLKEMGRRGRSADNVKNDRNPVVCLKFEIKKESVV